jgi:hypothetical protein
VTAIRLNHRQAREGRRTAFLGAVLTGKLEAVERAILTVVEDSFESHPMRHRTGAEEKRRAEITIGWLSKLCKEHGYTLDKALHTMRRALVTELDGGKFTPPAADARAIYSIDDALVPFSAEIHAEAKTALS